MAEQPLPDEALAVSFEEVGKEMQRRFPKEFEICAQAVIITRLSQQVRAQEPVSQPAEVVEQVQDGSKEATE